MGENIEIDIEKLKKYKGERRPFLKFKPPDGNTYYAYAVKFEEEPRTVFNKRFNREETHVNVELLKTVNDEEQKEGKYVLNIQHASLKRQLEAQTPLTDKIFLIMHRGKVKTKSGKRVIDYAVMPYTPEMTYEQLDTLTDLVVELEIE